MAFQTINSMDRIHLNGSGCRRIAKLQKFKKLSISPDRQCPERLEKATHSKVSLETFFERTSYRMRIILSGDPLMALKRPVEDDRPWVALFNLSSHLLGIIPTEFE